MRDAFLDPILPWVMKEGESKKVALILMKNSHFDRTLRYVKNALIKESDLAFLQLLKKFSTEKKYVLVTMPEQSWWFASPRTYAYCPGWPTVFPPPRAPGGSVLWWMGWWGSALGRASSNPQCFPRNGWCSCRSRRSSGYFRVQVYSLSQFLAVYSFTVASSLNNKASQAIITKLSNIKVILT